MSEVGGEERSAEEHAEASGTSSSGLAESEAGAAPSMPDSDGAAVPTKDYTGFICHREHLLFEEFLDSCRRGRYIGLCQGRPGVGKTLSARRCSGWDLVGEALADERLPTPPSESFGKRMLLYTPEVANTAQRVARQVRESITRYNYLLERAIGPPSAEGVALHFNPKSVREGSSAGLVEAIVVDEVDRLRYSSLEHLRDVHDRTGVALILVGMPGIERWIKRHPQLYSRVGFLHDYEAIDPDQLRPILEIKWEELGLALSRRDPGDVATVAAITRITKGNFRLLQRLFAQIGRVLELNDKDEITREVVETAREGMVVGVGR